MPSSRPSKPKRSVVVAFTPTLSTETPDSLRKVLAHLVAIRRKLRGLRRYHAVHVKDLVAAIAHERRHGFQKLEGIGVLVSGIGIRGTAFRYPRRARRPRARQRSHAPARRHPNGPKVPRPCGMSTSPPKSVCDPRRTHARRSPARCAGSSTDCRCRTCS